MTKPPPGTRVLRPAPSKASVKKAPAPADARTGLFAASRDLLVLALLADGKTHAYGLSQKMASSAGFPLPPGTLYPLLVRLEKAGWVRSTLSNPGKGRSSKREVELTAEGRLALRKQAAQWQAYLARLQGVVLPAVRAMAAREPAAKNGGAAVF